MGALAWILERLRPQHRNDSQLALPAARQDERPHAGRWINAETGLGGFQDRAVASTFVAPIRLDQNTLDALYEFDAMTARIVDREPDDAIREGYELEGFEDSGLDADAVIKESERLQILQAIGDARRWARLYGGGALIALAADGLPPSEPLAYQSLVKLRGAFAADRWDVTPATYDHDPESSTYGAPLTYHVGDVARGVAPMVIHSSRIFRFDGFPLPPRVRAQNLGWGGSVVDRVWAQLRNWADAHQYGAAIMAEFTQGIYMLKGLADAIDSGDIDSIVERLQAIRLSQSVIGHIALDAEGEGFQKQTTNVAGLRDLIEAFVAALVAVTEMPRTVLLGEQPAGLNANADSEIRMWYDHVSIKQSDVFEPALRWILGVMMRAREGPTAGQLPADWGIAWRPLWQPTDKEKAETRNINAQARGADVTNAVISPTEARTDPTLAEVYTIDDSALLETEAGVDELEVDEGRVESPYEPPAGEDLLDARSVGARLGVSARSIVGMHRRGEVDAWKVGGRWRFALSQVAAVSHRAVGGE